MSPISDDFLAIFISGEPPNYWILVYLYISLEFVPVNINVPIISEWQLTRSKPCPQLQTKLESRERIIKKTQFDLCRYKVTYCLVCIRVTDQEI